MSAEPGGADLVRIEAEVTGVETVARDMLCIGLHAPEVARRALPGQFVMLGPLDKDCVDPFLNRPFSVYRAPGGEQLELLVAVVGRGTAMLGRLRAGDRIGVLGPVGSGFQVPTDAAEVFLVGGGLGVAPLVFLAESLVGRGVRPMLVYGAGSRDALVPLDELSAQGVQVELATDDGSVGFRGTSAALLDKLLGRPEHGWIGACGPMPMLQAVQRTAADRGVPLQVSLETRMACGVGACLGCTVFLAEGSGRRVCCDGPVFDAREVFGP